MLYLGVCLCVSKGLSVHSMPVSPPGRLECLCVYQFVWASVPEGWSGGLVVFRRAPFCCIWVSVYVYIRFESASVPVYAPGGGVGWEGCCCCFQARPVLLYLGVCSCVICVYKICVCLYVCMFYLYLQYTCANA